MTEEILAEGKWLRLKRRGRWEYAERTGDGRAVVIVAVNAAGALLLVEQDRPAIGGRCIELPAGLVGDRAEFVGEALSVAAERELLEETGYAAEQLTYLTQGPPSPGAIRETIAFFLATGLRKVAAGGGDETENITVHEVPLAEAPQFLRRCEAEGIAVDNKIWAGLYFVQGAPATRTQPVQVPVRARDEAASAGATTLDAATLAHLDRTLPPLPAGGRVAILGGTFNPPHVGHALLAHAMLATEGIDQLWVVPVFEHPFGKDSADFDARMQMCERAFARLGDAVKVVPVERDLPKPSFTVQTLSALRAVRPGIELTLVIGSDIVPELPQWRDPEQLPHLSRVLVVPRQGAPQIEPPPNLDIKVYRGFALPKVSSTAIKKALKAGSDVDGWLDESVRGFIEANGLYR